MNKQYPVNNVKVYYNSQTGKEEYRSPSILADLQRQLENQITVINGESSEDPWNLIEQTKEAIRAAIEAHGVEVPAETPFSEYAAKINEIQ